MSWSRKTKTIDCSPSEVRPLPHRRILLSIFAAVVLGPLPARSDEPVLAPWPKPPFKARVGANAVNVRLFPSERASEVGLLHFGELVDVTGCLPACDAKGAWATLSNAGVVRLSLLRRPLSAHVQGPVETESAAARYRYARVRSDGDGVVFEKPDRQSPHAGRYRAGQDLAFRIDEKLAATGWLRRPGGGFMPRESVELHQPSTFAGEKNPSSATAFVRRDGRLQTGGGHSIPVQRYQRFPVLSAEPRGRLGVPGGTLSRSDVRIAWKHPRPQQIPLGARWVHVDLRAQVLTAYEGDKLVYATLVSTGRRGARTRTHSGLFHVWHKVLHAAMHGDPDDPYFVDEVPFVLYFEKDAAIHGTFWHDDFGSARSHGCVNLSHADAAWLFDWAPPALPPGWNAIESKTPSLWVLIQRGNGDGVNQLTNFTPEGLPRERHIH